MGGTSIIQGSVVSYKIPSEYCATSGLKNLGAASAHRGIVMSSPEGIKNSPLQFTLCPLLHADKSNSEWDLPFSRTLVARPDLIQSVYIDYWQVKEMGHVSRSWTSVADIAACFDAIVSPKDKRFVRSLAPPSEVDYAQIRWHENLPYMQREGTKKRLLLTVSSPGPEGLVLVLPLSRDNRKLSDIFHCQLPRRILAVRGAESQVRDGHVDCFMPRIVHRRELGPCQAFFASEDMERVAMRMVAEQSTQKCEGLQYVIKAEKMARFTSVPRAGHAPAP